MVIFHKAKLVPSNRSEEVYKDTDIYYLGCRTIRGDEGYPPIAVYKFLNSKVNRFIEITSVNIVISIGSYRPEGLYMGIHILEAFHRGDITKEIYKYAINRLTFKPMYGE